MEKTVLQLQTELIIREKLPVRYAGVLAAQVFHDFGEKAREGVMLWIEDRLPKEFGIGDYTVGMLMHDVGASAFEALCMMDVFSRHPQSAGEASWVRTYDEVRVDFREEIDMSTLKDMDVSVDDDVDLEEEPDEQ